MVSLWTVGLHSGGQFNNILYKAAKYWRMYQGLIVWRGIHILNGDHLSKDTFCIVILTDTTDRTQVPHSIQQERRLNGGYISDRVLTVTWPKYHSGECYLSNNIMYQIIIIICVYPRSREGTMKEVKACSQHIREQVYESAFWKFWLQAVQLTINMPLARLH